VLGGLCAEEVAVMAADRELVSELAGLIAALKVLLNDLECGLTPQPPPRRFQAVDGQGRSSKKPPARLKSVGGES
jgi:hypothetical protein